LKKRGNCVGGKLRAMESCRGKIAERCGKGLRSDGASFRWSEAAKLLRQMRSAGDCGRTATAKEASFNDADRIEPREKLEDVAAYWIRDFDSCCGPGQFARVARIAKMIENSFAEHF
jgi:hypothetical protein